jgi:DNA-directed RNA polymerase subunit RPC12/RpoP
MSDTLYKCDQCGQTFNSVDDLENHRRKSTSNLHDRT